MREETRKLYDYKLNIPSDMLKNLGILKDEFVGIRETEDGILLFRPLEQKASKTIEPINNIQIPEQKREEIYRTKIIKRKLFTIPKVIFDRYNLSEKTFDTDFELIGNSANTVGIIKLSNSGRYRFRKDNSLSLAFIFPELEIEEGREIEIKDVNGIIQIYFNYQVPVKNLINELENQEREAPITLSSKPIEKIPTIPTYYENKDTFANINIIPDEYKEEFKQKVLKRNTINIPSEVFKKYNYSLRNYNTEVIDNTLYINFDINGRLKFPKANTLNIATIAKPIIVSEQMPIILSTSENRIKIDFSVEEIKEPIKQEIKIEQKEEIKVTSIIEKPEVKIIESTKQEEIKEKPKKLSEDYFRKLNELKRNKSHIKFISDKDLPNETKCCKCSTTLTKEDNSMIDSHRVCNNCKRKALKDWFKPLYELAKLREEK